MFLNWSPKTKKLLEQELKDDFSAEEESKETLFSYSGTTSSESNLAEENISVGSRELVSEMKKSATDNKGLAARESEMQKTQDLNLGLSEECVSSEIIDELEQALQLIVKDELTKLIEFLAEEEYANALKLIAFLLLLVEEYNYGGLTKQDEEWCLVQLQKVEVVSLNDIVTRKLIETMIQILRKIITSNGSFTKLLEILNNVIKCFVQ